MAVRVFKKSSLYCVNVDSDNDATSLIADGWVEMSAEDIASVFNGKESLASPSTTTVDENGVVTFTAPPDNVELKEALVRKDRDCRMVCALDAIGKYKTQQDLITAGGTVANPITTEEYNSVLQYIEDLRNVPQQIGFPWDGPSDPACPWPTKPACVCDMSII